MGVFPKIKTDNSTFLSKTKCEEGHKWWVSFEFYPFAIGETVTVFEGRMYNEHGFWSQSKAVVKSVNHEIGSEENLMSLVAGSEKARALAQSFKADFPHFTTLNFVMPCLAEMDSISVFNTPFRYIKGYEKQLAEREHVLIEEFIEGDFRRFVDSNGTSYHNTELVDTFVHYSYVESNGHLVLSNIEGVDRDKDLKLSTVTIHSRNHAFGARDQGYQGILNVFKNHKCNNTCKNWPTPAFGLIPSAPVLSEKLGALTNCTKGIPMYINSKYLINPPSYEQSTHPSLTLTNERPLIHGK